MCQRQKHTGLPDTVCPDQQVKVRIKGPKLDVLETAEVFEFEALDEEAVVFQVAPSFQGLVAETIPGGSAART